MIASDAGNLRRTVWDGGAAAGVRRVGRQWGDTIGEMSHRDTEGTDACLACRAALRNRKGAALGEEMNNLFCSVRVDARE
jgi:hypothetical protein